MKNSLAEQGATSCCTMARSSARMRTTHSNLTVHWNWRWREAVMASPRWHKILADLKVSRSRTILVILSIAIGVFAVGTVLTARVVLDRGVDDTFDAANPASAVL